MRSIKNKPEQQLPTPTQRQLQQIKSSSSNGITNSGSSSSSNYNNKYNVRRKSRKKYKNTTTAIRSRKIMTAAAAAAFGTAFTSNKLLITSLLLITMTATTSICQANALAVTATQLSTSPLKDLLHKSAAAATVAAATSLLSPTQQRQQQQQQLFALLTKNRETSGGHHLLQHQQQSSPHFDVENADYVDENMEKINTSMETSGFVGDDGQQYEKAEQILASVGAAVTLPGTKATNGDGSGGVVNCPKECKCLNDFFDCGKLHLDRVPELPNYVQIM